MWHGSPSMTFFGPSHHNRRLFVMHVPVEVRALTPGVFFICDSLHHWYGVKGASAFYLCGSSGEGLNMSVVERKDMAEAAINAVAGRGKNDRYLVVGRGRVTSRFRHPKRLPPAAITHTHTHTHPS